MEVGRRVLAFARRSGSGTPPRAPRQPQRCSGVWLAQGVLEEVFLIKWPSPKQAILNTLLVIVIVGGTSALLFAVNTLLAELSRVIYS